MVIYKLIIKKRELLLQLPCSVDQSTKLNWSYKKNLFTERDILVNRYIWMEKSLSYLPSYWKVSHISMTPTTAQPSTDIRHAPEIDEYTKEKLRPKNIGRTKYCLRWRFVRFEIPLF